MNGRMEHENKIFNKVENLLKTMPDFATDWYYTMRASQRTARTCQNYIVELKNFLTFINKDMLQITLDDITNQKVTSYIIVTQTKEKDGEIVYSSVAKRSMIWFALNNFFEYLVQNDLKSKNYMRNIAKPKNRNSDDEENRVMLTEKDFRKILRATDTENDKIRAIRNKAILTIFMTTGIRRSAMTEILLDDIDIYIRKLVVIDKGNKKHEYVLNSQTVVALTDWLNVRDEYVKDRKNRHLFLSRLGNTMDASVVNKMVRKYSNIALGKPVSAHKLRAGYCSILYKKTNNIEFVRRAVGHSNASTTQRYIVTKGEEKKKASELMESIF